ncbi:MAG: bifunctional DNA primase/polymerase [Terracidiphilus sp.]
MTTSRPALSCTSNQPLAEAVRLAAERGWKLFPAAAAAALGKKPLITGWRRRATNSLDQLEAWASQFPGCNWGLATGASSGVVVVDVDEAEGRASVADLEGQGFLFPPTLTVVTGDGLHWYYRLPAGVDLRSSVSKLGPYTDVRSTGGYAIVPPSTHLSGRQYRYVDPDVPLAALPGWVVERLARPAPLPRRKLFGNEIYTLTEGQRNDGLTRRGGVLRRKGAGLLELEVALRDANLRFCSPPLPDAEITSIACSLVHYPVGGPDPLERAWAAVQQEDHQDGYEQFLALARQLQRARPEMPIALPLVRISALMRQHRTQVARWRQYAVRDGQLRLVAPYIAHRIANLYTVVSPLAGQADHHKGLALVPTPLVTQLCEKCVTKPCF